MSLPLNADQSEPRASRPCAVYSAASLLNHSCEPIAYVLIVSVIGHILASPILIADVFFLCQTFSSVFNYAGDAVYVRTLRDLAPKEEGAPLSETLNSRYCGH